MEYFDKHTVSTMVVTVFLVFSIFYLCVESSTSFSMTSLHLYHSFILVFPLSPLEIDPLLCFPIKYPPIYKKNNMEYGTHCIPNSKSEHNKSADHKRFHRKMVWKAISCKWNIHFLYVLKTISYHWWYYHSKTHC